MLGRLPHEVTREASSVHVSDEPQSFVNNWYFSRQELEDHTPSRKDGIRYAEESHIRKLYCAFLQELGMELQVPQMTIATAMMFCHRFYMRQSHAKNCWKTIATASMFLGCKAEETSRRLNDFTVVAYKLIFKWDPCAPRRIKQKEVYDQQKKLIIDGERVLLATLAFDLNIRHPYTPLAAALKRLDISNKELSRVAWNFVNDWLRTTLCLQYKPHYIAAGSIFLAAKILKLKLPKEKGKVWWMQFDVAPKHLEDVVQQMMRLLEHDQKQLLPKQAALKPVVRKVMSSSQQSCSRSGSAVAHDSGILATVVKTDGLNDVVSSKSFENQACSYVQGNLYETILGPNLISGKTIPSSIQSCTASGIVVAPDILPSMVNSGELSGPVLLKCNKVRTCSDVQDTPKEKDGLHCQTSDSGSVVSIVEDYEDEPLTGKSDPNSCTISSIVDVLHNAGGLNDSSVLSMSSTKPACSSVVQDMLKETCLHCQESDSGSAVSVVEDSEGEPITRNSDLKSSYKIVPVEAGSAKIDVNRIRETVKKRRKDRIMNQKLVGDTDDVLDGEAWIERELENGIEVKSAHSKRRSL